MIEGYGSKIYKSGRKPRLHYFFIPLLLVVSYFVLFKGHSVISDIDEPQAIENTSDIPLQIRETDRGGRVDETDKTGTVNDGVTPRTGLETPQGLSREEVLSTHNRAILLIKNRNFVEAIGEYENILKYDPRYVVMIGMCRYWMGEFEEAENVLLDADDNGYFPFQTKKYLALSLYRMNELNRSVEYAESALQISPDNELAGLVEKIRREESVMKDYKDTGTGNFLIQFSRQEHHDIRVIIGDHLKEAYREIGKELDFFPNRQFAVILYNERDFFDVTRAPGWAGGLYDGKIRIPVKGLSGQSDLLKKVIFHEYTHALVSVITSKCPLWLNEGLAEYFSGERADTGFRTYLPLTMIERGFPSGNIRAVHAAYQTSLAAVERLIERYGIYSIAELLQNLNTENDLDSAFRSVFFISYGEFVSGWQSGK